MSEDLSTVSPLLVAIDGPAGSGKSSVSREAAVRLGFGILDTGAAYRALAWSASRSGIDFDSQTDVEAFQQSWGYTQSLLGSQTIQVMLPDGSSHEITQLIRTPEVSAMVSRISRYSGVRERLNSHFLTVVAASELPGVVIEGRDITTVVAPDAPVRLLLTASAEVRALRRASELPGLSNEQVLQDLLARDAKDALVVDFVNPAPGVQVIDTTTLDFEQSVMAVLDAVRVAQATAAKGEKR